MLTYTLFFQAFTRGCVLCCWFTLCPPADFELLNNEGYHAYLSVVLHKVGKNVI